MLPAGDSICIIGLLKAIDLSHRATAHILHLLAICITSSLILKPFLLLVIKVSFSVQYVLVQSDRIVIY